MGKKDEAKGGFSLKVPKGTKDWDGKDMVIREKIFTTIANVFKRHGAVTIDTLVAHIQRRWCQELVVLMDDQQACFRAQRDSFGQIR